MIDDMVVKAELEENARKNIDKDYIDLVNFDYYTNVLKNVHRRRI